MTCRNGLVIVAAAVMGLGLPVLAHSEAILGEVRALSGGPNTLLDQHVDRQYSLFGELQASSFTSACVDTYANGEAVPVCDTASASIHADLAPGSMVLTASGKSVGLPFGVTLYAQARATLQFDVTSKSVWTLAAVDNTSGTGEYSFSLNGPGNSNLWWDYKVWPDAPRDRSVSLTLDPGQYQFFLDFTAVNLMDTGGDAGSLSLTMTTTPVPLPAAVWLFGSALGALWLLKGRPQGARLSAA